MPITFMGGQSDEAVFADTFYYLALISGRDRAHERSLAFSRQSSVLKVTTLWVMTELGDALAESQYRTMFPRIFAKLHESQDTHILPLDMSVYIKGSCSTKNDRTRPGPSLTVFHSPS